MIAWLPFPEDTLATVSTAARLTDMVESVFHLKVLSISHVRSQCKRNIPEINVERPLGFFSLLSPSPDQHTHTLIKDYLPAAC